MVSLLLIYPVIFRTLLMIAEIIVIFYLIRQYKHNFYMSKWKIGIVFLGVCLYAGSTVLYFLEKLSSLNTENYNFSLIQSCLEVSGFLLIGTGIYGIIDELIKVSNIDFLTKTYTNRYIHQLFEDEKNIYKKKNEVFSVIFIDIDKFKQVNDRFGHEEGNQVLSQLADILKEIVRISDKIGRYGGDEFIIILHNTLAEEAETILTRLRQSTLMKELTEKYGIGISAGVSTYPYDGDTLQHLSKIADIRMYREKESKNTVS